MANEWNRKRGSITFFYRRINLQLNNLLIFTIVLILMLSLCAIYLSKNSMIGMKNLLVIGIVICSVAAGGQYVPPLADESAEIWGKFYASQVANAIINQEISVQIQTGKITIFGCNTQWASFAYDPVPKDYTVGPFASTRIYCPDDQGTLISSTIGSSKKVYNKNGVIVFQNNLGYQVLKLTPNSPFSSAPVGPAKPVRPPQPPQGPSWPYEPIFTTPITLPGVVSTSFKGTYFFKPVATQFPTAIFNFDDDYLQFESCNFQRLPYAAYTDGVFCLLQGGSSTLRYCKIDYDGAYIQILSKTTRFQKSQSGYDLYDQDRLVAKLEKKVRNQVVKYNVIYGGYQLELKGVDVRVSQTTISFNAGCNSVSIPYQTYNGAITFGNVITTLMFCDKDVDSIYIDAITRAVTLKQISEGFALLDAYGVETIRFVSFERGDRGYQGKKWFGGNYKLQLPNSGIRLKIADGTFTLEGCNTHSFKFTLSDNGNIVFGVPSSTEIACEVNYDNVFLFALLKAQSIAVVGGTNILFFDGNNEEIVKAVNFEQSGANNQDNTVDTRSPVVPIVDYFFYNGIYKFSVVRTSLATLSLTVNKDKINWQGCNIWNMNYIAATDGTVKFYPGISTKRACQSDNDNLYVTALLSAVKFAEMKGMITFYDNKGKSVVSFVYDAVASGTSPSTLPPVTLPQTLPPVQPPNPQPRLQYKTYPDSFVSLRGHYKFRLPKINFDVLGDSFVFKGCNTHRIPCAFKNNNILFGQPISTNNNCQNDNDRSFLDLIPRVSKFQRNNNDVTFLDPSSQAVFRASAVVRKPELAAGISSGSYVTQPAAVEIHFEDDSLYFIGCDKVGFGYSAKNSGDFTITTASPSAKPCASFQNFDTYSNAVNSSTKYRKIDNGFILEDSNGNQKARCLDA